MNINQQVPIHAETSLDKEKTENKIAPISLVNDDLTITYILG